MGRTKDVKETGRYGARYGMTLRKRMLKILRTRYEKVGCPRCGKLVTMARLSVGVWRCPSCAYTYAGPAHTPKV
jgi:large subunit ribosomal protein L37Ae